MDNFNVVIENDSLNGHNLFGHWSNMRIGNFYMNIFHEIQSHLENSVEKDKPGNFES